MATTLGSPGISVSVIDESFYTPAAPGTTPVIFVASAEDKSNASGTGTAQGTTAANAGKVWLISSQRDLTETFGTPKFYTDGSGNPVHGGELNEYGLQAAYSVLGLSSRAYVVRADVDLASLVGTTTIPKGTPVAGTYWLDTGASKFGVFEWNPSGKGSFTAKVPLVIDDSNVADSVTAGVPNSSFGKPGDYAIIATSDNSTTYSNALFYKTAAGAWTEVVNTFDSGKELTISPHTSYPTYTTATNAGSVWVKTTTPGSGADWVVKYYNAATSAWNTVSAPIYTSTLAAIQKLDSTGGKAIPVGTLMVESNYDHHTNVAAEFKLWRRTATGSTTVVGAASATTGTTSTFSIRSSTAAGAWASSATITVAASLTNPVGQQIASALNASSVPNVQAAWDGTTNVLTLSHTLGGEFELLDGTGTPLDKAGFTGGDLDNLYVSVDIPYSWIATNWKPLVFEASVTAPFTAPADNTVWYDASLSDVDIMINDGTKWVGYRKYDSFYNNPLSGGVNGCDPAGPMVSSTEPTLQSDGTALKDGDIWVDVSDTETYGRKVYVYDGLALEWVLQDVTDSTSPTGWVFADARWGNSGDDSMQTKVSIATLLSSNYVDPDCVDPALYPKGLKLWNLRRSGFNVKKYEVGYINKTATNTRVDPAEVMTNYNADRWVTISPNAEDGAGQFGRLAQRSVVVAAMKAAVDNNTSIRDVDTVNFNLLATPGYPELIANMVALNNDRNQTALVVGDSPFRLAPTATALAAWGNNSAGAADNGDSGLVTNDAYTAVYYPSGYTNDNTGNKIVVPPSHMMLRTILNSDNKSYPWFAPAGTTRGTIDNSTSVGYLNSEGEFTTVSLYQGLRDVMASAKLNPLATLPGSGLVCFGQYTRAAAASSLDRINVARLVAYLRRQLELAVKPYLFEPNDAQTRNEVKNAVESILTELVGQRALNDYIVVCDTTNNTPARIDRSELWVDIAIEPVKAVEFIYIPLRLLNTGAIASGDLGASFPGTSS